MRRLAPLLLLLALVACGRREADMPAASPPTTSSAAAVATTPAPAASTAPPIATQVASATGTPAAAAATRRAPVVVFLGDSVTAGLGVGEDEAFPARVGELLRAQGMPIRVLNAGVSGDTSAGGLRRLSWVLRQRPDVVVVELGANDGLRGLSIAALDANLHDIVRRAQAAGASVLLLGVRVPPSLGGAYAEQLAAVYPRVARDTGAALVPFFLAGVGGHAELNQADGIHPNATGHRIVARNVAPALLALLRARAATAAEAR